MGLVTGSDVEENLEVHRAGQGGGLADHSDPIVEYSNRSLGLSGGDALARESGQ